MEKLRVLFSWTQVFCSWDKNEEIDFDKPEFKSQSKVPAPNQKKERGSWTKGCLQNLMGHHHPTHPQLFSMKESSNKQT